RASPRYAVWSNCYLLAANCFVLCCPTADAATASLRSLCRRLSLRRIHLPIHRIFVLQNLIQRNQVNWLLLVDGFERERLSRRWLHPTRYVVDLGGDLGRFERRAARSVSCIPLLRRYGVEPSCEHQRPVHHGLQGLVVRHRMPVQSHRQAELDGVTVLPWPAQSEITAAAGKDRQHSAVYLHAPA